MRACEYPKNTDKNLPTQLLQLQDLTLLWNGKVTASCSSGDAIMITFCFQKNGEKEESLIRKRGLHAMHCPVRIWASIVDRILSYPGTSMSSPVNTVYLNGKLGFISSAMITAHLRQVMRSLDKDFPLSKVTPHSIRASYATMLFQQGASLEAVKLNGRWKSNAFLLYICKNSLVVNLSPALRDQQNLQCIYVN
ncbi:hypothetical protein CTEN210_07345 [Chaetoceros tenuissimus]|uniref:Tyr recombinase domain-containing protein n=1 Tax=Chaetoceros tenuissimus TaxID=426638 RepID=A0AAD3H5P4_9STRA|nr:hypothetical protein CTEN210_07345 [Chaetoceros tenuissimus]